MNVARPDLRARECHTNTRSQLPEQPCYVLVEEVKTQVRHALHMGSSGPRPAFALGNKVPTSSGNFQEKLANVQGHQRLKHV